MYVIYSGTRWLFFNIMQIDRGIIIIYALMAPGVHVLLMAQIKLVHNYASVNVIIMMTT